MSPSSILILGEDQLNNSISMNIIDVNTMKLSTLDVPKDYEKQPDIFYNNQSVEWQGKVYMLGQSHIHVITKDFKKYECIKEHGYDYLE
jgi:hypothetical protein